MVVLPKVVFWSPHCIQKKPGEPLLARRHSGAGMDDAVVSSVRGSGYPVVWGVVDMVRTLVVHRGMGPGPFLTRVCLDFSGK